MRLEFCPKCGARMEFVVEGGRLKAKCPKCGYEKELKSNPTRERHLRREQKVIVVEEEGEPPMPTVRIECPRCGYNEAYTWTVQTRAGDEGETQFFKCKRCGYVWRLYT